MTIKNIFNSTRLSIHKRRMDRGGLYIGYITMLFTGGIFVKVFGIDEWWVYLVGAVLLVAFRYACGYFDHKYILKAEQNGYSEDNPTLMKIIKELEEIKTKL
jgi:hypothetical protein